MKKTYEKPATSVVMLNFKSYLLIGSPAGNSVENKFVDDENYEDWDFDGGQ
ncbi:MAG: hypothetical protein J6I32_02030 [Bacteroidaceae bacterium]|nr:hypothetical protein [Bacteroidaceae bacterium]